MDGKEEISEGGDEGKSVYRHDGIAEGMSEKLTEGEGDTNMEGNAENKDDGYDAGKSECSEVGEVDGDVKGKYNGEADNSADGKSDELVAGDAGVKVMGTIVRTIGEGSDDVCRIVGIAEDINDDDVDDGCEEGKVDEN